MADQETTRLCVWITKCHFGDIVANVVQALSSHGRLMFRELVLFTKLKPRAIRAALLVLTQHGLLWHSVSGEEEMYELNIDGCLIRLRFGKFLVITGQLFGDEGVSIVQAILDNGRMRYLDLLTALPLIDRASCQKITRKLIQGRFIQSTSEYFNKSHVDRVAEMEQVLIAGDTATKNSALASAKRLAEKKLGAEQLVREKEEEIQSMALKSLETSKSSKGKEKAKTIDDTIWFCVNYAKFNILIRNGMIEAAVRARFNESAAAVMKAILSGTEGSQSSLAELRSEAIGSHSILEELQEEDDLLVGLARKSSKGSSNATSLREYLAFLSAADSASPKGKSNAFLSTSSASGSGSGKVQVEFYAIYRQMKLAVLDGYVRERWDIWALRIVRILLSMGKMEEKQLSKVAMIAPNDVRPLISVLSSASIINLHEVPKGKDFMPRRTFYFWDVDLKKVNAVMLSTLTKTMANILERKAAESERNPMLRTLLETRERTDVAEDETLLSAGDKKLLERWEEKMMKLAALEARVEEAIFILRDLPLEDW
ncbi:hypothetical protein M408DRAFT_326822 [Serendipita vermifera MAFF 305830]|uniref:DNA-directed RNA polymerase III subunit RPC3 n=1 Tax=Serendipita vermifera MAFF 305830 TaxID=933852 RepID=A0A0C2X1N6_SERVB|nr:hypothetical protein M408DRAFT_326822 [Serendipita vermifera MAFF 305830]